MHRLRSLSLSRIYTAQPASHPCTLPMNPTYENSQTSPLSSDGSRLAHGLPDSSAPDLASLITNTVTLLSLPPIGLTLSLCAIFTVFVLWAAPGRVSRAMVAAVEQADGEFCDAAESGAVQFRGEMAEELEQLRTRASELREEYLKSCLSYQSSVIYLLKGGPIRLFLCQHAIQVFRTHTEIAKEAHNRVPPEQEPIVLRRRRAAAQTRPDS
ncbi:unnamed protein product [Mycena citricolor]|uniref:Uncharacterized protein n=1 Tax=Mycena citricolor TaxID=2018698 RepID=A0AAD2HF15_9AGAR|nr:unnamed protein product [Mycena citricolor]